MTGSSWNLSGQPVHAIGDRVRRSGFRIKLGARRQRADRGSARVDDNRIDADAVDDGIAGRGIAGGRRLLKREAGGKRASEQLKK